MITYIPGIIYWYIATVVYSVLIVYRVMATRSKQVLVSAGGVHAYIPGTSFDMM